MSSSRELCRDAPKFNLPTVICRKRTRKMGHQLVVVLATLNSAFVNLPPSWSNALWDRFSALKAGQVVVSVEWKDKSSESGKRVAYLGWAGGSSTRKSKQNAATNVLAAPGEEMEYLEIDREYARVWGLREAQTVNVDFVKDVTVGTAVHVEPLTPDDWEILELHAGYLEEQFLNQIRVVSVDQVIVVWVGGQTTIRLKVVEINPPAPCVKLDTDAEVIVAPKTRWQQSASALPAQALPPSAPSSKCQKRLTVKRARLLPASFFAPGVDMADGVPKVLMSSGTWAEDIEEGAVVYVRGPRGVKDENGAKKENAEPTSTEEQPDGASTPEDQQTLRGIFARIHFVNSIPIGHAWVDQTVRGSLRLADFVRIRLTRVEQTAVEVKGITLHKVHTKAPQSLVIKKGASQDNTYKEDFQNMIRQLSPKDRPFILTSGMTIQLPSRDIPASPPPPLVIRLVTKSASTSASDSNPVYALINPAQIANLKIETGAPVLHSSSSDDSTARQEELPALGGVGDLIKELRDGLKNRLSRGLLRRAIAVPALGGMLVYGGRGNGKSSLVKVVMHELGMDQETLAYVKYVNCATFSNEPIAKIKDHLGTLLDDARARSPTILVLDDLDKLLPAEQENTDTSRSRQLAEVFVELMSSGKGETVVLVGTGRERASLHPLVIESHVFGDVVQILPPSKKQREEILRTLISNGPPPLHTSLPTLDLSTIAGDTEGYSPADIVTLLDRTLHEAALRTIESGTGASNVIVQKDDFERARDGYMPAALRGVKLEKNSDVSWNDIGGLEYVKRTLLETLEWPTKYAKIFANCTLRLRSGLLLYGFPGCGKTLLASAVAQECGLNFISVKGPELLNKYIGASEQSVRDLFARARAAAPCVLFFDEFEAIAPRRGQDHTGVTDRVVNQMLTLMDGAEGAGTGVYVLAATSRPELIDPALLRPGRLDKSLLCDMPSPSDRLSILQAVAGKLDLEPTIDLPDLAAETDGFSGADLQALLYNAQVEAVHSVLDATGSSGGEKREDEGVEFVVVREREEVDMTAAERGAVAKRIESLHSTIKSHLNDVPSTSTSSHQPTVPRPRTLITVNHVRSALAQTHASLSKEEVGRLRRMYEGFAGGGAENVEVGGRATLA
ncbi:P-loop containing nucleoside triphosphate hydrolase protein [Phlyctochytrium arcticum]|nr:P-loop containing nucleoside triphosphate hydrolase protein [Phlyctochytrium arcticum]